MMQPGYSLLVSLALTLIFELSFAHFWGVRGRGLLLVFLMNLLTNPVVVGLHWIFVHSLGLPSAPVLLFLELFAVAAEGLCAKGIIRRPWSFALLVNLFSFSAGALLNNLIH